MISNTFVARGLIVAVLVTMLPAVSQAEVGTRAKMLVRASSTADRPAFSCDTIDTMMTGFKNHLATRADTLVGKKETRKATFTAAKTKRGEELASKRTELDSKRTTAYAELRSKATTSTQKAAVETFVTTVDGLVAKRRVAVDAAIAQFETGVAALTTDMQTQVDTLRASFTTDIDAVFANAKSSCTSDSKPADVKAIIKSGLEAMKQKRMTAKDNFSFKTKFEALRATREAAIKTAFDEFTTGMTAAKTELKTSFAKSS